MALSGLEIYKHLPKKSNCKECGVPTCLAFAMKVASGQAQLDECKHLTEAGKTSLSDASAPPQMLVKIGTGDKLVELGQETVLYRHEQKFHRPMSLAVRVLDTLDQAGVEARCKKAVELNKVRMKKVLTVGLIAVENASGDAAKFTAAAKAASAASNRAIVLMSAKPENLKAAGEALKAERPLLWAQAGTGEAAIAIARELDLPLVIEAKGFDEVVALTEKARTAGLKEMMLSPGQVSMAAGLEFLTQTRRAAILKKFRPAGYPVAMVSYAPDLLQQVVEASSFVLKYAGIVVVDVTEPHYLTSILFSRQDIYTDPQVPVQVDAGLHTLGDAGPEAPILITTNFALSYSSVESEVEAARVPAHIIAVNTDGTSVLTAWASDKMNAKTITAAIKGSGVLDKVKHKKVVLPGLVAILRAGLEDESGLEVIVGPKEASGLTSFLKNTWKA